MKRTATEALGTPSPESQKRTRKSDLREAANLVRKSDLTLDATRKIIADTFFESRKRFEERLRWTLFQQEYWDVQQRWSPFEVSAKIERFRDIEDVAERKAQILAALLTNSALHHYGSYELTFLLEYALVPHVRLYYGMFPKDMRVVLGRVAELMGVPDVELSQESFRNRGLEVGRSWCRKYQKEYEAVATRGSLPSREDAKKQIFYSFLWAIASGGCEGHRFLTYYGTPLYCSLMRRDY